MFTFVEKSTKAKWIEKLVKNFFCSKTLWKNFKYFLVSSWQKNIEKYFLKKLKFSELLLKIILVCKNVLKL